MRAMLKKIGTALGWFSSLGRKFFCVAPISTAAVQLTTLASQFVLLLAFFLPLKAVILLGAETVPGYFPELFKALGRDGLVVLVSVSAVVFYIVHMGLEFLVGRFAKRGAERLLKRNNKVALFENQDRVALDIYSRFARGLAAGVFSCLALLLLLVIYPTLFVVVVAISIALFFGLCCICAMSERCRLYLADNFSGFTNGAASVVFLLAFFCMIADFLMKEHPVIFIAVISLLLVRQGVQRLCQFAQTIFSLRTQYRRINALFFHSHPLISDAKPQEKALSAILESSERGVWIRKVISAVVGVVPDEFDIAWHQMGGVGIYSFLVTCRTERQEEVSYLVKIYEERVSTQAARESLILRDCPSLPALPFIGSEVVSGVTCNVFSWRNEARVQGRELGEVLLHFAEALMQMIPPAELSKQFKRSHPLLGQRLVDSYFDGLKFSATSEGDQQAITHFMARLGEIRAFLERLPCQLMLPDVSADTILLSSSGEVICGHWSNWRVEPLGAGWPHLKHEELPMVFERLRAKRCDLAEVDASSAAIASLLYSIERYCNNKNYQRAMELLPLVLSYLDSRMGGDLLKDCING